MSCVKPELIVEILSLDLVDLYSIFLKTIFLISVTVWLGLTTKLLGWINEKDNSLG